MRRGRPGRSRPSSRACSAGRRSPALAPANVPELPVSEISGTFGGRYSLFAWPGGPFSPPFGAFTLGGFSLGGLAGFAFSSGGGVGGAAARGGRGGRGGAGGAEG